MLAMGQSADGTWGRNMLFDDIEAAMPAIEQQNLKLLAYFRDLKTSNSPHPGTENCGSEPANLIFPKMVSLSQEVQRG